MTLAAVHASLSHLVAGQDRNKAAISDAVDAVVSAHQHGGKDAFDDRVTDLRATVDAVFLTMDAIHDTAKTAAGMPHVPASLGEAQSVEDATAIRSKARPARTGGAASE